MIILHFTFFFSTLSASQWMLDQINKDLSPFRVKGISQESLARYLRENSANGEVICIKIVNGEISYQLKENVPVEGTRFQTLLNALKKLTTLYATPDVVFIAAVGDGIYTLRE
jgi:hypothetical protein